MVSDVLFEAAEGIDQYLKDFDGVYDAAEQTMIKAVRDHMRAVQQYLDTPPFVGGTKRETVTQNEA